MDQKLILYAFLGQQLTTFLQKHEKKRDSLFFKTHTNEEEEEEGGKKKVQAPWLAFNEQQHIFCVHLKATSTVAVPGHFFFFCFSLSFSSPLFLSICFCLSNLPEHKINCRYVSLSTVFT